MSKLNKKKKKRKLSKKKIIIFLLFLFVAINIYNFFNTNISNIYISGNNYLNDQEIIDIAKLSTYPSSINNLSFNIEKKIEKNMYIYEAKVSKNLFMNKVYIKIKENYPLFYNSVKDKTVLYNGDEVEKKFDVFVLSNSVPIEVYDELIKVLKKIDIDTLNRISEMEYAPVEIKNEESEDSVSVVKDRFFLLMNDGNYVYITLNKFSLLNKYLDIVKHFGAEKGVLNLDSGGYFDLFD